MGFCNIKSFFNSDFSQDLAYVIKHAYFDTVNNQKLEKQKKFSTIDFYHRLIDLLKSEDTPFKVEYSSDLSDSQRKIYKEAFEDLKTSIIELIPESLKKDINMGELIDVINKDFQKDLNAGRLKIEFEEDSENFNIELQGASEEVAIKELPLKQFLYKVYGDCFGAIKQLKNQFSREMFIRSICDLENGELITTSSQLNDNIANYKNELFNIVLNFVSKLNPNASYPSSLYESTGRIHKGYYSVLQTMQDYLSGNNTELMINDEYGRKLFGEDSQILDAINAYTILKYFDSFLVETLGRTIKYDKIYKNTEVRVDVQKYEFSKDSSHQRKSWTDSENRTAVQNSSRFIKFVLESLPLEINGKDSGRNIGTDRLYHVISKLFSGVTELQRSKNKDISDLVEYILACPSSTSIYSYKIFKLISENILVKNELKSILKFTDDDLGVFESMYKYVFSYDLDINKKSYDEQQHKSIKALEFNTLRSSYNLGKYSILSDIVGAIDDCMDATYFYTEYGIYGGVKTQKRKKFKDRRLSEKFKDIANNINFTNSQTRREELSNECKIDFESVVSTEKATVTIPISINGENSELQLKIFAKGDLGILRQTDSIEIYPEETNQDIYNRIFYLFGEDSPIDLSSNSQRRRLLYDDLSNLLTEDEQLFKQVLKFIDKRLPTKFLSEDGLRKLNIYKGLLLNKGDNQYLKDLLLYAVKSQIVSDIYYEFDSKRLNPEDKSITSKKDFKKFLLKKYKAFANLSDEDAKKYFIVSNGITKLRTVLSSTGWVDDYAMATMILQGDLVSSVSKNQSNNNDANYVTQFLGGRIFSLCYESMQAKRKREKLIKENPSIPQVASGALLFTEHLGALKSFVINSDVKNRQGTVKAIRDLKASELFYNAIIHNFWNSFITTGEYCIQPTTYSDKVKLIQYMVDGKEYKHFNKKSLSQLSKDELIQLYGQTIGKASELSLQNVIYLYSQIWGIPDITLEQINEKLKTYTEEQLVQEAFEKGFEVQPDLHYRNKTINGKKVLSINEVLVQEAKYSDLNVLRKKFKEEELLFINNLIDSGVFFYIDYHDTSVYDPEYKKLSRLEQLRKSTSPVANILITLHESGEINIDKYYDKWIHNGKLILAYDSNGNPVLYKNTQSVAEINPILEKFFYIETLIANNLRLQLTGFETNHPDKSNFKRIWNNTAKSLGINNPILSDIEQINKLQKSKVWLINKNNVESIPTNMFNIDSSDFGSIEFISEYIQFINNPNDQYQNLEKLQQFNEIWNNDTIKIITKNPEISKILNNSIDVSQSRLSLRDLKGLNDGIDLFMLSTSDNPQVLNLATKIISIIENVSQGTQLKRNVPIPGTIHGMHTDLIQGVPKKVKVAVIQDMPADVFNFTGDKNTIDSMDGSAFTIAEQSILENKTLGSQEVGQDKKPLWHHYNKDTGTASLMKFASFEINNERMLTSLNSTVPLLRMYKKMTNIQWSKLDDQGIPVEWNTSHPIILGKSVKLTGINQVQQTLVFERDILDGKDLFYKTYDENGNIIYKKIIGFGGDSIQGYYTIEQYVDKYGDENLLKPGVEKVYHYFNSNSDHHTTKQEGDHTINSLYELWISLGGLYSQSVVDKVLQPSESSHFAVTEFMNKTIFPKSGVNTDRFDISQNSYDQPLKEMYIGYLTNNSAMKNGAANRNSVKKWFNDEPLTWMEMETKHLGIQMDADHDVEEAALMTEFSQVITSLESGGALHKYAKQVYKDLGKVATIASKVEIDTVVEFLAGEENYNKVKSKLYEVLGKILLNGIKTREDQANLTDEIMRVIEKTFHKNISHLQDVFKIPFSDSNIYSQILPTLVSMINNKSIKRKYIGSGCVMVPGYNVIQYFQIGENQYMFNDLVPIALEYFKEKNIKLENINATDNPQQYEKTVVQMYLDDLQKDPSLIRNDVWDFIPTDLVDLILDDGRIIPISLNNLKDYYKFKDQDWAYFGLITPPVQFRYRITEPKNLAPAKITFKVNGRQMNVFDLKPFRDSYENPSALNKEAVRQAFRDLHNGVIYADDDIERLNPIKITDLKNAPAENVISNMYRNKFGTGNKSIGQIKKEGVNAFKIKYKRPHSSENYDISFTKINGDEVFISFNSPKGSSENTYIPYNSSQLHMEEDEHGNIDVWLMSEDNRKQFKVGRYKINKNYSYRSGFQDKNKNSISAKDALKEGYVYNNEVFYNSLGHQVPAKDALKEDVIYIEGNIYDENGKLIPFNKRKNLKVDGSTVYEYIEFVSKYRVSEKQIEGDGIFKIKEYDKYYINIHNISKTFSYGDDSEKNKKQKKNFITNILDDIYATNQFLGITINPELSRNSASNIVKYVSNMKNIDKDFRELVILPVEKELRDKLNTEDETFVIGDLLKTVYTNFYDKLAINRYNSWELSLYSTAARIPAQTLQSFMQMKTVGYSGNSQNIVYVSHWQAWLQGSDYDIDKSYIMGNEIGDDGKIIKYSDLFDYSSKETLLASTWLPTPKKVFITNEIDQPGFDITEQLKEFIPLVGKDDPNLKATKIRKLADLLIDMYDYQDREGNENSINLVYNKELIPKEIADSIIKAIIIHERTSISPNLEESAYKNSISFSIRNIVQDLRNMESAYSPISMRDLQSLAENSEKGVLIASMSLMNPLTKYLMQVQNMVGKKVIGIAAVGEKVFFNLSYYYNEGVRSGNDRWINNLLSCHEFNRIQGRYAFNRGNGELLQVTKTNIANINFDDHEHIRARFMFIDRIDEQLRKVYQLSDYDFENKTEKWQQYSEDLTKKIIELSNKHKEESKVDPVDLIISQVLSAATDNAKELILAKINCGENLAKCHLYLIMQGFNIKDIVSFMTSPCVSLINDLTEANMFDSYITLLKVNDAINLAEGIIDTSKFLTGSIRQRNEYSEIVEISFEKHVLSVLQSSSLHKILINSIKQKNQKFIKFNNLSEFIQEYIKLRVNGEQLNPLNSYVKISDYECQKSFSRMSDYIERIIFQLSKARKKYMDHYITDDMIKAGDEEGFMYALLKSEEDFNADLNEFKKVHELANEISTFGGTFLGLNQGLPGTKEEIQNRNRKIKDSITTREKLFGISYNSFKLLESDTSSANKNNEKKIKKMQDIMEKLYDHNKLLNPDVILKDMIIAHMFDIIGNFNIEHWLYDKKLTREDIVNVDFMGSPINSDITFNGKDTISYRELIANYYNCIKGSQNMFDAINRIPQYKAIIDLYKTVYVYDKYSSVKSNLSNIIYDKVYSITNFIDERQNTAIIKYINDLLITSFFREFSYKFPIQEGDEFLDHVYNTKTARFKEFADLGTSSGRASFKMVFETMVLRLQQTGEYENIKIPDYKNNKFLQDLGIQYDQNEIPALTLELDMMRINSTPNSQKTYQEYLNGLKKLKDIQINGISLSDWFILYNLFVYQNQYGSDRMTTVFRTFINDNKSILNTYFKYIGDIDFKKVEDNLLKDLEFNIQDLLIRLAPVVSPFEVSRAKFPYIRTRNKEGEIIFMRKNSNGKYQEISIFPSGNTLARNDKDITEDQKYNYLAYQMIPMKNQDFNISLREGLMSPKLEVLVESLIKYSERGLLTIEKENC